MRRQPAEPERRKGRDAGPRGIGTPRLALAHHQQPDDLILGTGRDDQQPAIMHVAQENSAVQLAGQLTLSSQHWLW